MNRQEQAELHELMMRALNAEAIATACLYQLRPDMGEWSRTGELRDTARRELWEALYRIVVEEERQATKPPRI